MPFCPNCGNDVLETDNHCTRCGYDLKARRSLEAALKVPRFSASVKALGTEHLYVIDDEGILKVGSKFSFQIYALATALVVAALVSIFAFGNWIALTVGFTLLFLPFFDYLRARSLRRMLSLPRPELAGRSSQTILWPAVQTMVVKGRSLSFQLSEGWRSGRLGEDDLAEIKRACSSILGDRFREYPANPPRFSPVKIFAILALVIFAATQVVVLWASLAPFSPAEQQFYTSSYTSARNSLGPGLLQEWYGIYLNNLQVALLGLVPGYGVFTLAGASFTTGKIIHAAAIYFNVPATSFLGTLYAYPHSLVELSSYPLAAALGLFSLRWTRQSYAEFMDWRRRTSTRIVLGFGVVALVLAVAAFFEVTEPRLGLVGLAYWIPVAFAALYIWFKLRSRISAALT